MATASELLNATRNDPGQNSLITIEAADNVAELSPWSDDWAALTDDEKARFLVMSTEDILDQDNFPSLNLDTDPIYNLAASCAVYQAIFLSLNIDEINDAMTASITGATSLSGPVESKAMTGFSVRRAVSPYVRRKLGMYCDNTISIVRSR